MCNFMFDLLKIKAGQSNKRTFLCSSVGLGDRLEVTTSSFRYQGLCLDSTQRRAYLLHRRNVFSKFDLHSSQAYNSFVLKTATRNGNVSLKFKSYDAHVS